MMKILAKIELIMLGFLGIASTYTAHASQPGGFNMVGKNIVKPYGKQFIVKGVVSLNGENGSLIVVVTQGWKEEWSIPVKDKIYAFLGIDRKRLAYYQESPFASISKKNTICRNASYGKTEMIIRARMATLYNKEMHRYLDDRPVIWADNIKFIC
jgi:hypothetical protein